MALAKNRAGFTLVEFVMAVVLLSIIAGVTAPLMVEISRSWQSTVARTNLSENGRIAIDRMSREIRMIKNQGSVITATSSSFQFVNSDNQTILFDRSVSSLRRTAAGVTNILADNASGLSFTYFDANDAVLPAPVVTADIRRIQIDLAFFSGANTLYIESGVSPRRLQ